MDPRRRGRGYTGGRRGRPIGALNKPKAPKDDRPKVCDIGLLDLSFLLTSYSNWEITLTAEKSCLRKGGDL